MRARPSSRALPAAARAAALLIVLALPPASVGAQQAPRGEDARYAPIRRVFGQGKSEEGYFRVELPRTDLHVSIDGDALDPDFGFTSHVGFAPMGAGDVMAMGEIVLTQAEVPAVLAEVRRQGIRMTALHNHLRDESPRILYMHVVTTGAPAKVAASLRAVYARTATPLSPPKDEPSKQSWGAIDALLGVHADASGRVAEYEFPRNEALRVHGMAVKSTGMLETGSEVVFQQLSRGRVANTGELYLLASEVEPVTRSLEEHGLHVTALHTHMLDDGPPHFWVHWYAVGDGPTIARAVAATLAHTNSAQRSHAEQ